VLCHERKPSLSILKNLLVEADRAHPQVKLRELHKVDWLFIFSCTAHNLYRLPRLIAHNAG
jgi:hypothetical protein